jgi:hypothetical protein
MAGVVGVIWVCREEVYFFKQGWTGQITLKLLQKIDFSRRSASGHQDQCGGRCSNHDADEWQAAMETLLLVAERDGPEMFARIGLARALNRRTPKTAPATRRSGPRLSGGSVTFVSGLCE